MATIGTPAKLAPSEEADAKGLQLGQQQGEALGRTLRHMTDEVAESGGETECGEYLVGYAVEEAEGLYHPDGGELRWREPEDENVHIEVSIRDAADGRFIPGLAVRVTVIDEGGREIGTQEHPLLWHPYLYHYGRNWNLPGSGRYSIRVEFDPPQFARHDRENGRRFLQGGDALFSDVEIKLGRK